MTEVVKIIVDEIWSLHDNQWWANYILYVFTILCGWENSILCVVCAFMRTIVFVCISYCFTSANTKPKCWINSLTIDYKNHKIIYVYEYKVTAEPS